MLEIVLRCSKMFLFFKYYEKYENEKVPGIKAEIVREFVEP